MEAQKKKAYIRLFLNIFMTFVCITVSVIIFDCQDYDGYELLFTQPILYLFIFVFIFSPILVQNKIRIFFIILAAISGIRYVLLPLLIVVSGYYGGRSSVVPNSYSLYKAILIMNYELIAVAIFIKLMEIRGTQKQMINKNQFNQNNFYLVNKNYGYFLFGAITILGVALYPSALSSINFIIPSSLEDSVEPSFMENIVIYCVIILKQLVFVSIVRYCYKRYIRTKKEVYIIICFIAALINICIYFGTNRSDIIISAVASFLLMYKLFKKKIKKYFLFGTIILIALTSIVSNARNHVSISHDESKLIDITDIFQVYTGGVYNVALALETKEYFPEASHPSVLFFDIFRPMIGINVLVKNLPFKYSNMYFNERIWLNTDRRSQIIPMIGQGNLFFGFLFAPLFSIIFIKLQYYFERKNSQTKNLEIFYFLSLVICRLGFFMGQNTMNMINDMSMNLVLFLAIFFFNRLVRKILSIRG